MTGRDFGGGARLNFLIDLEFRNLRYFTTIGIVISLRKNCFHGTESLKPSYHYTPYRISLTVCSYVHILVLACKFMWWPTGRTL